MCTQDVSRFFLVVVVLIFLGECSCGESDAQQDAVSQVVHKLIIDRIVAP